MTPAAVIRSSALALGIATTMASSAARAEGNRLLPFWAQPYPSGYAYGRRFEPCPAPRRGDADRYRPVPRCGVVLHARD